MREKAIKKVIQEQHIQHSSRTSKSGLSEGDYFHDGCQVLDDVINWHRVLRSALRKTDTMTSRVLDLVDQKMLRGVVKERIKANDLCAELRQIVAESQAEPRKGMPESIMAALLEVDEEASSNAMPDMGRSFAVSHDRKARKSKRLDFPLMKTTHRSEYLKSALAAQDPESETPKVFFGSGEVLFNSPSGENPPPKEGPLSPDPGLRLSPQYQSGTLSGSEAAEVPHRNDLHRILSEPSILPFSTRPKPSRTTKTHPPQDVFQARQDIKKREKRNYFRRTRKDELLTSYFGNRDLVSPLFKVSAKHTTEILLIIRRNFL